MRPNHGAAERSAAGLTQGEVQARILSGQTNNPPPATGRTLWEIVRANIFTRFNAILGSLLIVVGFVGPLQDGLFGVVLVVNTSIGVLQEIRAKRTLERLAILTAPRARVVRDGSTVEIAANEVVSDDLLDLRPGDQAVVDAVVRHSEGLEIDESLLTGEARPVAKEPGDPVLSGTFVVSGTGRAEVTEVGEASYATRLEAQARRFSLIHSELQAGTNKILKLVTWVMVPAGIGLVLSQLLRSGQSLSDALRGSVAGVAAMVPEGLVLLTSIAFAVGALRLARRRVLVQELAAVEGLARVDVVCIDKTGTLTTPGMQLEAIEPISELPVDRIREVLGELSASDPAPNATMQAIARGCPGKGLWAVEDRVPFSSERKWSAVTFADRGTWALGAPETIADRASRARLETISASEQAGRRVLILARAGGPMDGIALDHDLVPVALVVFAEQLRTDASTTIRYLLDQDVTIKVLSGDAPQTVAAIADCVGIPAIGSPRDASLIGEPRELAAALSETNVFGRVRPAQKLSVVKELQAQGHVVAMVGDGVNDIGALKESDLGIAMGSGSQSSRSVARIVLLDNSFSAVPHVLAEGRRVIANIGRVANLFVTKTVYATLLAVVVAIAAVPFPFFPRHLTVISTFTIGIPGFVLAFAKGAPRASTGFTKRVLTFTLPAGVLGAVSAFATYSIARASVGTSAVQARTAAMLTLFAFGLWILLLLARPLNVLKGGMLIAMAGGLCLLFAVPLTRRVFALQWPKTSILLIVLLVVGCAIGVLGLLRSRKGDDIAR